MLEHTLNDLQVSTPDLSDYFSEVRPRQKASATFTNLCHQGLASYRLRLLKIEHELNSRLDATEAVLFFVPLIALFL